LQSGRASRRKRFSVRADEKLTAFLKLQRAIHEFVVSFDLVMAALLELEQQCDRSMKREVATRAT
jgi:hypothetical protein